MEISHNYFDKLDMLHDQNAGPSKTITNLLSDDKFLSDFDLHNIANGAGGPPPKPLIDISQYIEPLETVDVKNLLSRFCKPITQKVGFFTPVQYPKSGAALKAHGLKGRAVQFFDSYFHLGGKVAYVATADSSNKGSGCFLKEKAPWYMVALKVISYATLVIPAIMLIGKAIARSMIQYEAHSPFLNIAKSPNTEMQEKVNDTALELFPKTSNDDY